MTKNSKFEKIKKEKGIVLFDGFCNLCSWSVQFILKRDPNDYFRFASLQSEVGKQILESLRLPENFDKSVILIENNKVYFKSGAALRITRKLRHFWPLAYVFMIVPRILRNLVYNFIAKNRFKWFGKKDTCFVPKKNYQYKFLV